MQKSLYKGRSALENNQQCFYNGTHTIRSILEDACVGKQECAVLNDVRPKSKGNLGVKDPCKGQYKDLGSCKVQWVT